MNKGSAIVLVFLTAGVTLAYCETRGQTIELQSGGWVTGGYTDNPAVLCVNGHPARRRPGVTYGGLAPRRGFERDHICPLGLGCPDILDNLQYQPYPDYVAKDEREREAEETYCRNPSPTLLDALRAQFKREWSNQ